ncbi:folylpolyglutamate synthase [Sarocladium implicatum]|nr:folylpolyglutamate synthase [Sarocladium implicatum]
MTRSRTYDDAIDALNTLQTPHAVLQARHKAGIKPDASFVHEMKVCLQRIGYTPSDLSRLNIIHVAGTKGKGSTCAYVDSILAQYRHALDKSPLKTGLFISPHLIAVRERIRINSLPVSKDLFASYFFDVWDRLAAKTDSDAQAAEDKGVPQGTRPTYARFLTLMSWHLFLQEGVDVAVYETGIGGEFDATNLVQTPLVSGITSLGIDHIFALGDTIEKISWHKAGIMKTGSPAFTVKQSPAAAQVLEQRAQEKQVDLKTIGLDRRLADVKIRPQADFQKSNASLAVALAETALRKLGCLGTEAEDALSSEFVNGIQNMNWRGRCEIKKEGNIQWCLDGAHTADSIKMATKWFLQETQHKSGPRILIFNQQGRPEALDFLTSLFTAANSSPFTHVIFTTNLSSAAQASTNPSKKDFINNQFDPAELAALTVQRGFAERWKALDSDGAEVALAPSVEDALGMVRGIAALSGGEEEVQVFVTGSLHLVGAVLGTLEDVDAL